MRKVMKQEFITVSLPNWISLNGEVHNYTVWNEIAGKPSLKYVNFTKIYLGTYLDKFFWAFPQITKINLS